MTRLFLFGLVGLVIASGICSTTRTTKGDDIYVSYTDETLSRLQGGIKCLRLRDLASYGNFGLGKPEGKGGVIILDGIAYAVNEDGGVERMKHDMNMPAAAVKFFRADKRVFMTRPLTLAGLEAYLDSLMQKQGPAAVKVQGRFAWMKYRNFRTEDGVSVFPERRTFERQSVRGAMVGFYEKEERSNRKGSGYHFHFIDRNRTTAGVVDGCVLKDVYIEIDYAQEPMESKADSLRPQPYPLANILAH